MQRAIRFKQTMAAVAAFTMLSVPRLNFAKAEPDRPVTVDAGRDDKNITKVIEALDYIRDRRVQEWAAQHLGTLKDSRAVPALIKTLKYKDTHDVYVRATAAGALGEIGDSRAVPILIDALNNDNWFVRECAAGALGKIKDRRAVPGLIKASKEQNEGWDATKRVWIAALWALGEIKDPKAISALISALRYSTAPDDVQGSAVDALVKIGNPAIPGLLSALKDKNYYVVRGAIRTLFAIKYRAIVPALIKTLDNKSNYAKEAAASALGGIGDKAAVRPLLRALNHPSTSPITDMRRRHSWKHRLRLGELDVDAPYPTSAIIDALGKLNDPEAVPALIGRLHDYDWVVLSAVTALGNIKDPRAIPGLMEILDREFIPEQNINIGGEGWGPSHEYVKVRNDANMYHNIRNETIKALLEMKGNLMPEQLEKVEKANAELEQKEPWE